MVIFSENVYLFGFSCVYNVDGNTKSFFGKTIYQANKCSVGNNTVIT